MLRYLIIEKKGKRRQMGVEIVDNKMNNESHLTLFYTSPVLFHLNSYYHY